MHGIASVVKFKLTPYIPP